MANKSDHPADRIQIEQYLPEVYQSDINTSVFEGAFNRHLTKDDTTHISGYVGDANTNATLSKRLVETDPHISAYQLEPVVVTQRGSSKSILTQESFLAKLRMIGIDVDRLQQWGRTTQFNWVPPINIDMLTHYYNYYWRADTETDLPQYFTIENRCGKAQARTAVYKAVIRQRGETVPIVTINAADNIFVVDGQFDDVFTPRFEFDIVDTTNRNFIGRTWTVLSTVVEDNVTYITPAELIAISSDEAPLTPTYGQWWIDTTNNAMFEWTGSAWVLAPSIVGASISLTTQLANYQAEETCACDQQTGWDNAPWDDSQTGNVLWNDTLMDAITHITEEAWELANGAPQPSSMWYNPETDQLRVYNDSNQWVTTVETFSRVLSETTGKEAWDSTKGCIAQVETPWASQNHWMHKTAVDSLVGIRRAQVPILEYHSALELNTWVQNVYTWKYRSDVSTSFEAKTVAPSRLELDPIKEFHVQQGSTGWIIYLYDKNQSAQQNIDYTDIFVPGFSFRVTNDVGDTTVLTARFSYMKKTATPADPASVVDGSYVTVVEVEQDLYTGPLAGGGADHVRIEPILTSIGDAWRGYHTHWVLDTTQTYSVPAQTQQRMVYDTVPVASSPAIGHTVVGGNYQEVTLNAPTDTVPLATTLTYNNTTPSALFASTKEECRVYVNGVRQYETYTLTTTTKEMDYVVIGSTPYTQADDLSPTFTAVTSVVFDDVLPAQAIVRVEIGASALSDVKNINVPVRTIEDDDEFATAASTRMQPLMMSLPTYSLTEQVKAARNQYPLFNMYDVVTGDVVDASSIFSFLEDEAGSINVHVQRRISASSDGRDFDFEQHLLGPNNEIRGYRLLNVEPMLWFSPSLNEAKVWDGTTYNTRLEVTASDGAKRLSPIVCSSTTPTTLLDVDGALWLDSTTDELYQRNTTGGTWVQVTTYGIVRSDSDPTLRTVWRVGNDINQYIPSYVDANRAPVSIGAENGSWGMLDQWFFNAEHANSKTVSFSQVITHFNSILNSQLTVPALFGGGVYTYSQDEYNYSVGGTIKEHNDSFDTLISAANTTTTNPVGVIEFARSQYSGMVSAIIQSSKEFLKGVVASSSPVQLSDLVNPLIDAVITNHENNDFTFRVYGDSVSEGIAGEGIKNWVATLPLLGFGARVLPNMSVDGSTAHIIHHDGHRTALTLSVSEKDRLSRDLCAAQDVMGFATGVISDQAPPTTWTGVQNAYAGDRYIGRLWYTDTGSTKTLYQLQAYAITTSAPDTRGVPAGAKYYNSATQQVYENTNGAWTAAGAPSTLTELWVQLELPEILASVVLSVEQRLYAASADVDTRTITTNHAAEQSIYDAYMYERFLTYVREHAIIAPTAHTTYNAADPFTWNYMFSTYAMAPSADVDVPPAYADYRAIYTAWYGTPVPHLEPWKLQGYGDKPTWWDAEYLNDDPDTYGDRRWKYIHATTTGMWQNIKTGTIPVDRAAPVGVVVPTYNYVPVNIGDIPTNATNGFDPDDLLPPYFNVSAADTDSNVRSIFTEYNAEIVSPNSDFSFGAQGPIEYTWRSSDHYRYDELIVEFLMQPTRFMHSAFGPEYITVDRLDIDRSTHKVPSHVDVLFHGDVSRTDQLVISRGLNQWYVNFDRYSGYSSGGILRSSWAEWSLKLGYQLSGICDTSTFRVTNKFFDITAQDYSIDLAVNQAIDQMWVDSFKVSVLSIPPAIIQYNNEAQWKFSVTTNAPVARNVVAYGVQKFTSRAVAASDVLTIDDYPVISSSTSGRWVVISGNHQHRFSAGNEVTIVESGVGNGTYTVRAVSYDSASVTTKVTFTEAVPTGLAGILVPPNRRQLTWAVGDMVVITSTKTAPHPLQTAEPYFVIPVSAYTYKLANTYAEALAGTSIVMNTEGQGTLTVGKVSSTFNVYGGQGSHARDVWFHYMIDRSTLVTVSTPTVMHGIQTVIDLVDGYEAYQQDQGIYFGVGEFGEYAPDTGKQISWSGELERFIYWAYGLRETNVRISDRYEISVMNQTTDEFMFASTVPVWVAGTRVSMSTTGALPTNVLSSQEYYYFPTGDSTFKLSEYSSLPVEPVDLVNTGSGTMFISQAVDRQVYPTFEINPMRNQIIVDTPVGMLSNVVQTRFTDARSTQSIYDQYGRPLLADKLFVFRADKQSRIVVSPEVPNDVEVQIAGLEDWFNFIHIGGARLVIDGYQHVLTFNNNTVAGTYVYNPFVGLCVRKFNLDYYETTNYTLRPTIGGHYLEQGEFKRNIEGSIADIQTYYSAYDQISNSAAARASKLTLDYRGDVQYLSDIGVTPAAQFAFYRGLIQAKGSTASMSAYINSRRFLDARLDEYWAWKIADFGDSRPKYYPEIKLRSSDSTLNDIQLVFTANADEATSSEVVELTDKGFEIISSTSTDRFFEQPDQQIGLFMDAQALSVQTMFVGPQAPVTSNILQLSDMVWIDTANSAALKKWNGAAWVAYTDNGLQTLSSTRVMIRMPLPSDAIKTVMQVPVVDVSWRGEFSLAETYSLDDAVVYNGLSYVCIQDTTGNVPTDGVHWELIVYTIDNYVAPASTTNNPSVVGRINSELVEVKVDAIMAATNNVGVVLKVYGLGVGFDISNPSRLIDTMSRTVVATLPIWDPARGQHYAIAEKAITVMSSDPAQYEQSPTSPARNPWMFLESDTVWLDTTRLVYKPYYDDVLYPNITDRLRAWGKLADWASVDVYKWVESTIPPEQWDDYAEAGAEVTQGLVASGTAKKSTFYKTRSYMNDMSVVGATPSTQDVAILDENDTPQLLLAADAVGLVADTTYTFRLSVDGTGSVVSVVATPNMTVQELVAAMQEAAGDSVLITLEAGVIVFTMAVAAPTALVVSDGTTNPLFSRLLTLSPTLSVVPGVYVSWINNTVGTYGSLRVPVGTLEQDDTVVLVSAPTNTLVPTGEEFVVQTVTAEDEFFDLLTLIYNDGSSAPLSENINELTIAKGFSSIQWIKDDLARQRFEASAFTTPTSILTLSQSLGWIPGDVVSIYINGVLAQEPQVIPLSYVVMLDSAVSYPSPDIIDVVKVPHLATDEEEDIADGPDDGTQLRIWKGMYEYSTATEHTASGSRVMYYFWVQNEASRTPGMSAKDAADQLREIPVPYMVQQLPMDDPTLADLYGYGVSPYGDTFSQADLAEQYLNVPVFYRAVILRSLSDKVMDDDRYIVRFTRDNTLRSQPNKDGRHVHLKSKHEEWVIFRKNQLNTVDPVLWNKAVEAMTGRQTANPTIRVPSLERALYDDTYGTDTRFGLGEGQAFADRDMAVQTLVRFLQDPTRDFYPIDMDLFITTHDFTTADGIEQIMADIYSTFGSDAVNELWFEILADALTTKRNSRHLMKTSWVALHGIRILDVGGMFDD